MTDEELTKEVLAENAKHRAAVDKIMLTFGHELISRGVVHDSSKSTPQELHYLVALRKEEQEKGSVAYGSAEYIERTRRLLAPMLKHHYASNPHHPQHYEEGIEGMNLFDLLEMLADWRAASVRRAGGIQDCFANLDANIQRFDIPAPIAQILRNTLVYINKHKEDFHAY